MPTKQRNGDLAQRLATARREGRQIADLAAGLVPATIDDAYRINTEVAHLLAEAGCDAETVAAGSLHDTIEDVDITYEMLVDEFGARPFTVV